MKKTNISYLKEQLSSCIQQVKEGEEYLVLDRKTPVAVLRPYQSDSGVEERDKLVAEGILRPGKGPVHVEDLPAPLQMGGESLSAIILDERDGR